MSRLPVELPSGWLPPYGTELSVESFAQVDERTWATEGLTSAGQPARYEIVLGACEHAACRMDGIFVAWRDPWRHEHGENVQPVEVWYEWVLVQDAQGHRLLSQDDYGGDTEAAREFRKEQGIVELHTAQSSVLDFATCAEMQRFLDAALATSPVRTRVVPLTPPPYGQLAALVGLVDILDGPHVTAECCDALVKPMRSGLGDWFSPEHFLQQYGAGFRSMMRLSHDGSSPQWMHAIQFLSRAELRRAAPVQDLDDEQAVWWGIEVGDTDVLLFVPRTQTSVDVCVDNDGRLTEISILPTDVVAFDNQLEDGFLRRWGRWQDPAVVLTDAELREGIAAQHALLDAEFGGHDG